MSNLIIPPDFQAGPASIFAGAGYDEDLAAAISAGFGLIGYRGKTWSIRYKGDELPLMRQDGDGPLNSIEVVILAAPNHLSKTWYESGWTDGATAAPDCASSDGEVPDAGVPKKQNDVCITCKWNAFGSRPAMPGQTQTFKGKACSDNKRLAVVPLGDIMNEQFGGPMLLRCPPASLSDIANLGALLKQIGFPYYATGIKISFDTTVSYPKFIFKPLRALTNDEGKMVLELRALDITQKIIHGDAPASKSEPSANQKVPPQQADTAAAKQPVDNVVPLKQEQQPPPQQAEPVKATGFGGVAAAPPPAEPAASPAPAKKTASAGAFGGGTDNGMGASPQSEPVATGVPQFDAALDQKLEGLLGS